MADDIVSALRAAANTAPTPGVLGRSGYIHVGRAAEAADEIERLRRIERLARAVAEVPFHAYVIATREGEEWACSRINDWEAERRALFALLDQKEQADD